MLTFSFVSRNERDHGIKISELEEEKMTRDAIHYLNEQKIYHPEGIIQLEEKHDRFIDALKAVTELPHRSNVRFFDRILTKIQTIEDMLHLKPRSNPSFTSSSTN